MVLGCTILGIAALLLYAMIAIITYDTVIHFGLAYEGPDSIAAAGAWPAFWALCVLFWSIAYLVYGAYIGANTVVSWFDRWLSKEMWRVK